MNLHRQLGFLLACSTITSLYAQSTDIISPDGNLKVTVTAHDEKNNLPDGFNITYKNHIVLPYTQIGLETDQTSFFQNLKLESVSPQTKLTDDYTMLTGKRSQCTNQGIEQTFHFKNEDGKDMNVIFRVYNNGVTFKYQLPATGTGENITQERTTYTIPQGQKRWFQPYSVGYERFYPLSTDGTTSEAPGNHTWGYPALLESGNSTYILFTEADVLRNQCGSQLNNQNNPEQYQVKLIDKKLATNGKWESPWRVLIVGSLADVVESTLVTDVATPSRLKETEWIKSGVASWIYWAHNHGSRDFKLVKDYIDLAADMKWEYNLIDAEWDEMGNGGTVEDALMYAHKKGIKPMIWYNSTTNWINGAPGPKYRLNAKEDREKEFSWLQKMGVTGVKIDFFPDDNVDAMNYYIDLVEDAARYHLMVNFHGATIPRGWQRTYPNLMSFEAVYGAEWYNNNSILTKRAAAHNATLPFTRNVIGPMDYTPGTFTDSQHPHITTHAHELALPILFESALQHMPDRPETYRTLPQEVKDLLSALPASWDDTRLLAGYPGEYAVMARRKGNTWYISGINGTDAAKTIQFSLDRLNLKATISALWIQDGKHDKDFAISKKQVPINNEDIKINCLPRGGFVIVVNQ